MDANFGIIAPKSELEVILFKRPPEIRYWGDEPVEVGAPRYGYPGLNEIEFRICPLTTFMRGKLPPAQQAVDLEYAQMTGVGLDEYESSFVTAEDGTMMNAFEAGLTKLLNQFTFWAVLFAPGGDRLEEFLTVDMEGMMHELRRGVRDLRACNGFLAVCK
ncbi:hypothetical protein [Burkholderia ubonensis]|uniref:Uncharacterized protein n=1 Tax=Burkholderia ubonensis subsp. mesacidophila TaxID=265293 RepID=A0A2A4FAI2_9BURK|nr:hypothetical protein [Burkholderia ubonensis]PCE30027.1 hypothetical protein BZL54_22960 [Burkholderia ubonensis subsp. mesacidophila]